MTNFFKKAFGEDIINLTLVFKRESEYSMDTLNFIVNVCICLFYKAFTIACIRSILKTKKVSLVIIESVVFCILMDALFGLIQRITPWIVNLALGAGTIVFGIIALPFIIMVLNDFDMRGFNDNDGWF